MSPVNASEYICGKIVSIGIISIIVGMILMLQENSENLFLSFWGIFLGSVIFSLCGIIVGTKIESLNQYIVWTIPFEIVGFVPVILYRMGFLQSSRLMLLHPGCGVIQLINGNVKLPLFSIVNIIMWIVILFVIADMSVKKMFRTFGGAKM